MIYDLEVEVLSQVIVTPDTLSVYPGLRCRWHTMLIPKRIGLFTRREVTVLDRKAFSL